MWTSAEVCCTARWYAKLKLSISCCLFDCLYLSVACSNTCLCFSSEERALICTMFWPFWCDCSVPSDVSLKRFELASFSMLAPCTAFVSSLPANTKLFQPQKTNALNDKHHTVSTTCLFPKLLTCLSCVHKRVLKCYLDICNWTICAQLSFAPSMCMCMCIRMCMVPQGHTYTRA